MLAFEREMLRSSDTTYNVREHAAPGSPRPPLELLASHLQTQTRQNIESITIHPNADENAEIQTSNHEVYFVNRYTGATHGPASPRLRAFFENVTALHRWFGLAEAHHKTAIAVKGATTILMLFMIVSGAILWIPARLTRQTLSLGTVPRLRARGRACFYNWHKVAGFWVSIPLTVIVVTGIIMAYPWANALLFQIAGSAPATQRTPARGPQKSSTKALALPSHLNEAFDAATANISSWRSATLRLRGDLTELRITVDHSDGGHPDKRDQIAVNPKTLQVVSSMPFQSLDRGQRWRSWVRFTHTGEAGGWLGETLALLTAVVSCALALTGLALFLYRIQRWRHSSQVVKTEESEQYVG